MSVIIDIKKKAALRLSNSLFGRLHRACSDLFEDSDSSIKKLLVDTDQDVFGPGAVYADIAVYLKRKKEVLTFAELIKKATEMEKNVFCEFENGMQALDNFHQELLKYAEELE